MYVREALKMSVRSEPIQYKTTEAQRRASKKHYEKVKNTLEFKDKRNVKARDRWKNDPVYHKYRVAVLKNNRGKHVEKERARCRRYRAKKALEKKAALGKKQGEAPSDVQ